jgi:hypothetical protein
VSPSYRPCLEGTDPSAALGLVVGGLRPCMSGGNLSLGPGYVAGVCQSRFTLPTSARLQRSVRAFSLAY